MRILTLLFLTGCAADLVELNFHVYEPLTGNDIEDVEACDWPDAEECVHSDSDGLVTTTVEASSDVYATMRKDGYYPRFFTFVAPEESGYTGENAMITTPSANLVFSMLEVEEESGTGIIGFSAMSADGQSGIAGVSVAISPQPPGIVLAMNLGDDGLSTDATETGSVGAGSWINVPPGEYVVTFSGPTCTRLFGLDTGQPNEIGLEVIAGHWTHIDATCE